MQFATGPQHVVGILRSARAFRKWRAEQMSRGGRLRCICQSHMAFRDLLRARLDYNIPYYITIYYVKI